MYESLKTELEKDAAWKGADIDSVLTRTKFNDEERAKCKTSRYYTYDEKQRHNRCMERVEKRPPKLTKKPDFKSFLDKMYEIQYYYGFGPVDDFADCVCCPLIYDSKPILFNKLKGMLTNISEEPKHSIIKEHKLFNMDLLRSGIRVSIHLPGDMSLSDAYLILNNIDKLDICQNCTYAVMCIIMYEATPLTEYRQVLFNDKYSMHYREMSAIDRSMLSHFLKTNDIKYLKQFEHIICSSAAWYKELD